MIEEIEQYLMDHFDGRGNDYDETIESFEINDNEVVIESWIPIEVDISLFKSDYYSLNELKRFIFKEVVESDILDLIKENYVCGFYCDFFEELRFVDLLHHSNIICRHDDNFVTVYLELEYNMHRGEIERMYSQYKNCA